MKEQLVSFETAKLAKEKGFWSDKIGFVDFYINEKGRYFERCEDNFIYPAPTQSLLQKWLREKYNFHVSADINDENTWDVIVINLKTLQWPYNSQESEDKGFNSYEEAFEIGLLEGLKLIKKHLK